MSGQGILSQKSHRRQLSLSVRVSLLLMLAAILPLIFTVIFIELLSRPALIAQTSQEMVADARTHTQLIDNFFAERVLEVESVSRLSGIQNFLNGEGDPAANTEQARIDLATGHGRGSYYINWTILDMDGNLKLSYPFEPLKHGQYYILPEDLRQFPKDAAKDSRNTSSAGKRTVISSIFYNGSSQDAYIDIYSPVIDKNDNNYKAIGIVRVSFDVHYIWDIVNQEVGVNGTNSYAFILDQRGVCIAYSNFDSDPYSTKHSPHLFKVTTALPRETQQVIREGELYGGGTDGNLSVFDDPKLAEVQGSANPPTTFQMVPPDQHEDYQVARSTTYTVPWTYFVLSPLSVKTAVADEQLRLTIIITVAILILAIIVGLGVGRRITRPILQVVENLQSSSKALKLLADKEQGAATQQTWVVDSSRVGLKSVQYYTKAASVALRHANDIGVDLVERWPHIEQNSAKQAVQSIIGDMRYVEEAVSFQEASNKKLASTIDVTTQVAEQLAQGATSAADAADQLEEVVGRLQRVVGK